MKSLIKLGMTIVIAGILLATMFIPVGLVAMKGTSMTTSELESTKQLLNDKNMPVKSTLVDSKGGEITDFFGQNRTVVATGDISYYAKLALISIEDKRFFSHNGVDAQGALRALAKNLSSGGVSQGASTIEQQYIKNYNLYVNAKTDAKRAAAVEQSVGRKLTEMQAAMELNKIYTKDEILGKYLNLMFFGNGAYGIEAAAQTYYGKTAKMLNIEQSALLIGMLQATSMYDPYVNPKEAKEKRDIVIDSMVATEGIRADEAAKAKKAPLGILKSPKRKSEGCMSAGDQSFYCDYLVGYLADKGITTEDLRTKGYRIQGTIDPVFQQQAHNSAVSQVDPKNPGIAGVVNFIAPGKNSHDIIAMASSRVYGLNQKDKQTQLPLTHSAVGHGAGSTFKVFTAAAAMQKGIGIDTKLPVPSRIQVRNMGTGGAAGCPENMYCVENAGSYPKEMTLTQALAQSPNTTFISLIEYAGVRNTMDMAVRLGLRSYKSGDQSVYADVVNRNAGAFTLGYTSVNPLEMANVGATLASGGVWCPPNPIKSITDRFGNKVTLAKDACEQVVESGLANTLMNGMRDDAVNGTVSGTARSFGWTAPMAGKTGTTESNGSAAFLGITNRYAGFGYVFSDSMHPQKICTGPPAYECGESGNIYGADEPARMWFGTTAGAATRFGSLGLPGTDPRYVTGKGLPQVPDVKGMTVASAKRALAAKGYQVRVAGDREDDAIVTRYSPERAYGGTLVTITGKKERKVGPKPSEEEAPPSGTPEATTPEDNPEESAPGTTATTPSEPSSTQGSGTTESTPSSTTEP